MVRHGPGLLLVVALHLLMLYLIVQQRYRQDVPSGERRAIQWLLPLARSTPPGTAPATPQPPRSRPQPQTPTARLPARVPDSVALLMDMPPPPMPSAAQSAAPTAAPPPDDPFAQQQPTPPAAATPRNADDILRQAKRDLVKIDKDLRREYPVRGIHDTPLQTTQARLERGIDAAHEAAPPKWYQGAKMVELNPHFSKPTDQGTRMYKVITAFGSYCILIQADGRKRYVNCPK